MDAVVGHLHLYFFIKAHKRCIQILSCPVTDGKGQSDLHQPPVLYDSPVALNLKMLVGRHQVFPMNGETIHICLYKLVPHGGAVLKIAHGLYPGFSPYPSLNAPPGGLFGLFCQRVVFYPGIQQLCKSLCIFFISGYGICLSQAYKKLVAVELKDKFRIISRHVIPGHFPVKMNRHIGPFHIPPQIK